MVLMSARLACLQGVCVVDYIQQDTAITPTDKQQEETKMTTFAEKLKSLRKQFKLSQEQLAEKIDVSRQAITKWETDGGLPDIENLMAISALFSVTIDELLSSEQRELKAREYAFESVTEYDIESPISFDIHASGAMAVTVSETDGEKLRVRLASNVMQTLEQDFKVRIDEHKNRADVDIRRVGNVTETEAKAALVVEILLPAKYCTGIELATQTGELNLENLAAPFELDGKAANVSIAGASGAVSLNSDVDMEIICADLPATIEINQISATSKLFVPQGAHYRTKTKGKSNTIRFMADGAVSDGSENSEAPHLIELAGMNAELIVIEISE